MAKRRVAVELEDVESMLGELAEKLDQQGKVTAEEVAAVDPVVLAEVRAKRPVSRRERFIRYFSAPRLGWPMTILLWLIIVDSLYGIILWFRGAGDFFSAEDSLTQLQVAGIGLFFNILPIARIAAVFMLFRYKRLGVGLILLATLVWMPVMGMQFQYQDDNALYFFTREGGLLVVLFALTMMKWYELD